LNGGDAGQKPMCAEHHDNAPFNQGPITRDELREFLHLLAERILKMDATLQKLSDDVAKQATLIDELIAQKNATNDADVATITTALEANNTKIKAALTNPTA
jgi:hypothetical protein